MNNLLLHSDDSLATAKSKFNHLFPFLKIEFYSKLHKEEGASWSKHQIREYDKTLGEIHLKNNSGVLHVRPQMTVAEFEQNFQTIFGFGVQVFRKSKDIWLETTVTDSWILEQQNHTGKMHSTTESHMEFEEQTE